ncbi:hypothetical protein HZI73_10830 [Vallitalea pronyensis]|uniref:Beta-xylosidase n=1 Tax=Vallitalea pronyensis TaxID=1348613 RepID=A0A8J8SGV1_9FIRM|nr:glycoside hydrolase family 52 protein [Vallitalea pronyensis]QUI22752.1 hypothetical protein HZI73_10830 [Vallitalea pronyensis]
MHNNLFQSLHSPIGAGAAFAIGLEGTGGGFMLENDYVPEQDIFIGYREEQCVSLLPFYKKGQKTGKESYTQEEDSGEIKVESIAPDKISRTFGYGTDTFRTEDIEFSITSRFNQLPDIEKHNPVAQGILSGEYYEDIKRKVLPVVVGKLVIDNRLGDNDKEGIFAISGNTRKIFLQQETKGRYAGYRSADGYGFAVDNRGGTITEISDFDFPSLYRKTLPACLVLGPMSGILFQVPKGEKVEVDMVFGWFKEHETTEGLHRYKYLYTDYFNSLLEVFDYGFSQKDYLWVEALEADKKVLESELTEDQKILVNQAAKSYYVSSMLFSEGNQVRWVMNEGSFLMMNTFDLIIDHMFFDLRYHGWVLRNQLAYYVKEYSYYDQCGISFSHDQGVRNLFAPQGHSSYEIPNTKDCFSYMTQEELCNWIITASIYVHQQQDIAFAMDMKDVIKDSLASMMKRDGDEALLDGIMDVDSSRCGTGAEITTYDSLDESLGQARRNIYMAVKCFASYLGLVSLIEAVLEGIGEIDDQEAGKREMFVEAFNQLRKQAEAQALLGARTINGFVGEDGTFPAIVKEGNETMIIPIVEGVIYPFYAGMDDWLLKQPETVALLNHLRGHIDVILTKGKCLFDDGGWKLSATSVNSWMSKIFLCQHIVEKILDMDMDMREANKAHVKWWIVNCPTNPGIDQVFDGHQEERGFHYPRAVTNTLWW